MLPAVQAANARYPEYVRRVRYSNLHVVDFATVAAIKRASRGKHISMSNAPCQPKPFKASGTTIADPVPPQLPLSGICAGKSGDGMREIAFN